MRLMNDVLRLTAKWFHMFIAQVFQSLLVAMTPAWFHLTQTSEVYDFLEKFTHINMLTKLRLWTVVWRQTTATFSLQRVSFRNTTLSNIASSLQINCLCHLKLLLDVIRLRQFSYRGTIIDIFNHQMLHSDFTYLTENYWHQYVFQGLQLYIKLHKHKQNLNTDLFCDN